MQKSRLGGWLGDSMGGSVSDRQEGGAELLNNSGEQDGDQLNLSSKSVPH